MDRIGFPPPQDNTTRRLLTILALTIALLFALLLLAFVLAYAQ